MKSAYARDMGIAVFVAAPFTRAKLGCLSKDERIKQKWYIYIQEYYSAIKKNRIRLFA